MVHYYAIDHVLEYRTGEIYWHSSGAAQRVNAYTYEWFYINEDKTNQKAVVWNAKDI